MKFFAALVVFAILLTACEQAPWLALPEQRHSLDYAPTHAARVIEMSEPAAEFRIVRDIDHLADSPWRWSQKRPAVRIRVRANENLKYVMDFAIPAVTLKDTGPVTVTFLVNDHVLDRITYSTPGAQHFEKVVPVDWLKLDADAIVGAEIDKLWVSPTDGTTFGIPLVRLGLEQ